MKKLWIILNKNITWIFSGIGSTLVGIHRDKHSKNIATAYVTNDKTEYISEEPSDGVSIKVGEKLKKKWTIRNAGTTVWRNRYMKAEPLPRHLHASSECVKIPIIRPGETYTLQITYNADYEGVYHSYWKMYDESNNLVFPNLEGLGVTIIVKKRNV